MEKNATPQQIAKKVEAFKAGDEAAFQDLYQYSFSTVECECYKTLHTRQDLDDCVQESYIKIYQKIGTLSNPEKFLGWCRTIAHNTTVSFIDHNSRKNGKDEMRPPVGTEEYIGMDSIIEHHRAADPVEASDMEFAAEVLSGVANAMTPVRAMAMSLYQQGYSFQEIAEQLTIPLGTAKSHVTYAKRAIKKEVERLEKEDGITLHAFTILPAASGFRVTIPEDSATSSGWIHADGTPSQMTARQKDIWKHLTKELSLTTSTSLSTHVIRITAIALAVAAIIVGVIAAVRNADNDLDTTKTIRSSTTISESDIRNTRSSPEAGQQNGQGNVQTPGENNPAQNNENTTVGQATQAPATSASRTRQIFSNVGGDPQSSFYNYRSNN